MHSLEEREMSGVWWRKTKNSKDATAGDIGSAISQYWLHIVHRFFVYLCVFPNNTQTLVALRF